MIKAVYNPSKKVQKDLIKTTDACVAHVFEQGKEFIHRNNIPQDSLASIPMSVAFTIINSIIQQATDEESLTIIKGIIMGNIEQMFLNAKPSSVKIH
jgi:hypothetical protein